MSPEQERERLRKIIDSLTKIYESDSEILGVSSMKYSTDRDGDYGERFYNITVIYD